MFMFFRALPSTQSVAGRGELLLPLLLLVGIFGTAAASTITGTFFGVLGAYLVFHFYRLFPSRVPRIMLETFTLYTVFLYSAFVWSINYYFSPQPWVTLILIVAGFFAMFRQSESLLGAWVGTLIMAEFAWVLLFWPVHFFTAAVVMLAVFYLIYMISHLSLIGKLSRRKIYFQVSLISIVVLIALLSSAWQPISRI